MDSVEFEKPFEQAIVRIEGRTVRVLRGPILSNLMIALSSKKQTEIYYVVDDEGIMVRFLMPELWMQEEIPLGSEKECDVKDDFKTKEPNDKKSVSDIVKEYLLENEIEALTADGFDEAMIGLFHRFNTTVVAYDYDKCIELLIRDGMTSEDAEEYFSFNVLGAWVGESTPAFLQRFDPTTDPPSVYSSDSIEDEDFSGTNNP